MPENRKYDYLRYCHEQIDKAKNTIYVRASVLLAGNALVAGQLLQRTENIVALSGVLSLPVGYVLMSACATCTAVSLVFAVLAIHPMDSIRAIYDVIMQRHLTEGHHSRIETFTAFPHISAMTREEFLEKIHALTDASITEQLANAMFTLACITEKRYITLRRAFAWFFMAVAIGGALLAFCGVCAALRGPGKST